MKQIFQKKLINDRLQGYIDKILYISCKKKFCYLFQLYALFQLWVN